MCVCVCVCVCVEGVWFFGLAQLDVSFSSPASYFPQFFKTQKPHLSLHRLDSETVAPLPGHASHSCPCLGTHTLLCGYAFNTQSHSVHPSSDSQTTEIPFYRQGSGGSRKGSNLPDWAPTNSCRAWEEVGGGHQAPRSPQQTCSPGCVPAPWVSHWPALVSCLIFLGRRAGDPNTKLQPPRPPQSQGRVKDLGTKSSRLWPQSSPPSSTWGTWLFFFFFVYDSWASRKTPSTRKLNPWESECWASAEGGYGLWGQASFAACKLCDLRQVTRPLWASGPPLERQRFPPPEVPLASSTVKYPRSQRSAWDEVGTNEPPRSLR